MANQPAKEKSKDPTLNRQPSAGSKPVPVPDIILEGPKIENLRPQRAKIILEGPKIPNHWPPRANSVLEGFELFKPLDPKGQDCARDNKRERTQGERKGQRADGREQKRNLKTPP